MLEKLLHFLPIVVAFFVTDRLLSKFITGSWWKQPGDVDE